MFSTFFLQQKTFNRTVKNFSLSTHLDTRIFLHAKARKMHRAWIYNLVTSCNILPSRLKTPWVGVKFRRRTSIKKFSKNIRKTLIFFMNSAQNWQIIKKDQGHLVILEQIILGWAN